MNAYENTPVRMGTDCQDKRARGFRKAGFAVATALVIALGAGSGLAATNALCAVTTARVQATQIAPAKRAAAALKTAWIQVCGEQETTVEVGDEDDASMQDCNENVLMNLYDSEMDDVQEG